MGLPSLFGKKVVAEGAEAAGERGLFSGAKATLGSLFHSASSSVQKALEPAFDAIMSYGPVKGLMSRIGAHPVIATVAGVGGVSATAGVLDAAGVTDFSSLKDDVRGIIPNGVESAVDDGLDSLGNAAHRANQRTRDIFHD